MKISLNWLKEFTEVPSDPRELKRTLTGVGLGVESISTFGDDSILEVEVTTNRPDCLNHYGVAREVATAYRVPLKKVEVVPKEYGPLVSEYASVEIVDPDLCARYCARVVRNVQVKPSPDWLAGRLTGLGARPINNVTDVTNYVLLELGHPLHAFDLSKISEGRVEVRRARSAETLVTLDGIERKLDPQNLVIADATRPVALAGVMGGFESGISDRTRSVLLESAWFDPLSIRRTAKTHGMHTEASHRFERGADIEMAPLALDRATQLIVQLAGGEIMRGKIDVYPRPQPREKIDLRRSEMQRILGAEILWEDVERILRSLGFTFERRATDAWRVIPPSFRLDVTREVDLIEEVARHFGYDRFPSRLVPALPPAENDRLRQKEQVITQTLTALGYREIQTSPMVDPSENARFSAKASVLLQNPLSQEASALRTTAMPTMLAALRWNLDRGHEDLRLFEIGKTYWRPAESPEERQVLALGLAGYRRPETVYEKPQELSFFDLKGDLETLLEMFAVQDLRFEPIGGRDELKPAAAGGPHAHGTCETPGVSYLAAGLAGKFLCRGGPVAVLGKLAENLGKEYKLRRPVWLAEIDLERLLEFPLRSKSWHEFSRFPAVQRDFSLIVPEAVNYGQIASIIQSLAVSDVIHFLPVEVFRSASIGPAHYGLLLRVTFQSLEHTLTGEEIGAAGQKVLDALAPLGIRLRQ